MRAEVNRLRVAEETSLMAKGVFGWAQHESATLAESRTTQSRNGDEPPAN